MSSGFTLLQIYGAMARHAAEAQRVSATNVAHANEPGYKAHELESFQDFMTRVTSGQTQHGLDSPFRMLQSDTPGSPNGNSVSLETEAYKSAEAMGNHTMALTVYGKTLDFLRSAMGKM